MSGLVEFAPEVQDDVAEAAGWYEDKQLGLGSRFIDEVICVWEELADDPLLNSRRRPARNIRWRYTHRFPYRVIYEVDEVAHAVRVAAVLHASRHELHWRRRL